MQDKKEIIKSLLNDYAKKRLARKRQAEEALVRARKDESFNENYILIKDLEYKIAESEYTNKPCDKLKQDLKSAKLKQKTLLKKLDINANDFNITFECDKCQDTGFIGDNYCPCFKAKLNESLVKASGLEISSLNSFDNFNEAIAKDEAHHAQLARLKEVLLKYANKFPKTSSSTILLTGKTGVGKTFALECVTSKVLSNGYTANFLTAFQLNNQFLKYHTCFDANKQSYLNILLDPDLLVIDDLGTEPMLNNVTKEYLYLVVSERMLKSKGTLISTNLNPGEILSRYGERVFSRLFDKTKSILIKIDGNDLRQLKRS